MIDPLEPLDQQDAQREDDKSIFSNCWEATGCPRSDYLACPAFKQRKNCYELDRVICCSKHRDNCSTCSVYIALNRIPMQKVMVHVSTGRMEIEGHIHLPMRMRFSDYFNREEPGFIVVTEARIAASDGSGRVTENDVAVVNRDHVITAWPIEEEPGVHRKAA